MVFIIPEGAKLELEKNFQKLSKIDAFKYETKVLLKIMRAEYLWKKKKIRTRDIVKADYNDKAWKEILESKYWLKAKDLKNFTTMSTPDSHLNEEDKIICLIDGNLVKTTHSYINDYCYSRNCEILKQFVTKDDVIVELGCGFGLALFSFKSRGIDNEMEGYDVSENGISAARQISDHFNCKIKLGIIDLSKPFKVDFLKGKTVFTSHSFEQLRHYTYIAIKSILASRPKQIIHFEPVPELLGWRLLEIVSKKANEFADYQNNLLSTLRKLEKENLLRILDVKKLKQGSNPFNYSTLLRWEPT